MAQEISIAEKKTRTEFCEVHKEKSDAFWETTATFCDDQIFVWVSPCQLLFYRYVFIYLINLRVVF